MNDEAPRHPLLVRQIRQQLAGVDLSSGPWREFLGAVDAAYGQMDQEREFVERTLDVVSEELTEANQKLQRDAEMRIREINQYYGRTLDLHEGLVLCFRRELDGGFIHTLCRGQLIQAMGYQPEGVEGHRLDKILRGPLLRRMHRIYNAAWMGKVRTMEGGSKHRGVRFLAVFHPRKEKGKVTEVIVSAVEISELKATELALRMAKQKAESADRAKSDFLAVMSHEIRTPMNSVIGFASLLATTELTEEQAHFAEMIETSGESLLEIINDVLDISKIEAGRLELSLEAVDPTMLAQEVIALMHSRVAEKPVTLNLDIPVALPPMVRSDRARLRQILINLLGNALKFTAKGSVTLRAAYKTNAKLEFRVIDTGIGIPPDRIDRLFKPFSQVDSSTTRNYGGTGLGLAICKRLSEAMGGGVTVTSEVGQGSCFSFVVDAPEEEAVADLIADSPDEPAVKEDLRPIPTILVVDDNPINRKVLGVMLKTAGYPHVSFVEDGEAARDAVTKQVPDLVFMDVEMPVMDGLTATREIRALSGSTPTKPWIIGLSANVWKDTIARAREAGMNDYLVKPVRRPELAQAIQNRP